MIIDFHTHCYPDNTASKALNSLEKNKGVLAYNDGTLSALKKSMIDNQIDISVVLPIANRIGLYPKITDYAKSITNDNIISFGSVYHGEENWQEQISYIKQCGLKGIKFHPDFQEFYFNEQRIIDMMKYAADLGLIITVHVGIDPACRELVHSTPQMARYLIDSLGYEKLVLAHLGGHLYWNEVLLNIVGTNCYLDTALSVGAINSKLFIEIMGMHGFDKILFGSDNPWGSQTVATESMRYLNISSEDFDKIMFKNAMKLLGV